MTLTVRMLVVARPALERLARTELPARAAFQTAGIIRLVEGPLEDYLRTELALYTKYGKADPEGNITVLDKHREQFEEEREQLLETVIELGLDGLALKPDDLISNSVDVVFRPGDIVLLQAVGVIEACPQLPHTPEKKTQAG